MKGLHCVIVGDFCCFFVVVFQCQYRPLQHYLCTVIILLPKAVCFQDIEELIQPEIIRTGEVLRLRAIQDTTDRNGK